MNEPDDEGHEDYTDGNLQNQDRMSGWHPGMIPRSSEGNQKVIGGVQCYAACGSMREVSQRSFTTGMAVRQ
jgi:hypothetical protein